MSYELLLLEFCPYSGESTAHSSRLSTAKNEDKKWLATVLTKSTPQLSSAALLFGVSYQSIHMFIDRY